TTRSSASLDEIFSTVLSTNPRVILTGAAIFDFNQKTYTNVVNIDKEAADLIENVCRMNEVDYFAHCIFNNMLTIYYERLTNPGSQAFYNLRKDHFDSFACNVKSHQDESCYYIVIDNLENIDLIERLLKESPHGAQLNILKTRNFDYPGYFMLKICSNETNKFIALSKLVAIDHNLITFGGTRSDVDLMKNSEVSFCLNSANDLVKNAATHILNSSDVNDMTKQINKCFHRKNIK
ncbi:MAG: HAD hydrolase family protein, partial [Acholeplasmatales bacterium]|nr:HAD hydrolase family protein [Acholeplasmatales bacterium]